MCVKTSVVLYLPDVRGQLTVHPTRLTPCTSSSRNSAFMTFLPDAYELLLRFEQSSRLLILPFRFFVNSYRATLVVSLSKPRPSAVPANNIIHPVKSPIICAKPNRRKEEKVQYEKFKKLFLLIKILLEVLVHCRFSHDTKTSSTL